MVGVTYKSNSCRPANSRRGASSCLPLHLATQAQEAQEEQEAKPVPQPPSFKDKDAYQELFKPLPKPEPLPEFKSFKVESKSWRELQEERETMLKKEIEKTRLEAVSLWERAKEDDSKRLNTIMKEKQRIENEQKMREEIMKAGNEERLARDKARKEEIRRQEELLSGRTIRSKTADSKVEPGYLGGGIQILHYKDPVVEQIVQNTKKEEIRRRMSHGEILRGPASSAGVTFSANPHNHEDLRSSEGQKPLFRNTSNANIEIKREFFRNAGYVDPKLQGDSKEFFKSNVMLRSGSSSSSSTTSR